MRIMPKHREMQYKMKQNGWRCGVVVECQTRDQEVAGSSLGGALRHRNSEQVSHTYVPLSPSSIIWYQ